MAVTVKLAQTFEGGAYGAGNLNTQDGYAQVDPGAHNATLDAGSKMDGVNSVKFTSGGATTPLAVEKAIGATRAAAERWRIFGHHLVETGATAGFDTVYTLTKGSVSGHAYDLDAIAFGFHRNNATGKIDMTMWDSDNAPGGSGLVVANVADLDTKFYFIAPIKADDTFEMLIDRTNTQQGYLSVYRGALVAANVAFTHFHFGCLGTAFVTGKQWWDNIYLTTEQDDVKVNYPGRKARFGKVSAAAMNADGVNVDLTIKLFDLDTGAQAGTDISRTVGPKAVSGDPADNAPKFIDQILTEELQKYDKTQNAAVLNTSGHGQTS